MILINGKKIAKKIEDEIKKSPLPPFSKGGNNKGGLGVILIGDNPASHLYVKLKEKAAKRAGVYFEKNIFKSPFDSAQGLSLEEKIIKKIEKLNANPKITGIIVQLPLPKYLDTDKIIRTIDSQKDADGYHPENLKKFQKGEFDFYPPVLGAVLECLKITKTQWQDKKIVLVSNSNVFSIPFQAYFKNDLIVSQSAKHLSEADIIITAVGKKHYLKADMVKNGVIIIDVGISKKNKKIYGDADMESLKEKVAWLTPVPGGVGPITVACLLKNVIKKI